MKRYSAKLIIDDKHINTEALAKRIERLFSDSRNLLSLNRIIRADKGEFFILLTSEAQRDVVGQILEKLAAEKDIQIETIGWGWPTLSKVIANDGDSDPYSSVSFQETDANLYRYGAGMILVSALSLLAFVVSAYFFVHGLLNTDWPLICFGFEFCLAIGYILMYRVRSVWCDQQGIEIRYWFRGNKHFGWEQVTGIKVFHALGERWCSVQVNGASARFQVNGFYGLSRPQTLIKTIVERAFLVFVEGNAWDNVTYKRFNAP